jgi:hypothetical protein
MSACCAFLAVPAFAEERAEPKPLPSPESDEQLPRPYRAPPERDARAEMFDLGFDLGVASRPADSDSIHYSVGPTYGVHGRAEVLPWLGVRVLVSNSVHAVSVDGEALLAGTSADQPSLQVLELGARVEPTLRLSARARAWLGVGLAWNRIWADRARFEGRDVQGVDRTGVAVEYSAALGGTFDVIPRWLTLGLALSAARIGDQSGRMFDDIQGVDEDVSRPNDPLVRIAGLPDFRGAYDAVLSVGLLL